MNIKRQIAVINQSYKINKRLQVIEKKIDIVLEKIKNNG
jgi:hypothetical protein